MLAEKGLKVTSPALAEFLSLVKKLCHWFPEDGSLTLAEWKKVGKALHKYAKEEGEDKLPPCAYPLWLQIRELLARTSDLEGLEEETASMILTNTEAPSYGSLLKEAQRPPDSHKKGLRKSDDDWDLTDEMTKQDFEDDFRDHHPPPPMMASPIKKKERPVPAARKFPPLPPSGFKGAMEEARRTGNMAFSFPLMESIDDDFPT
ncbi:hypothetical protein STEG23_020885 [Scotinomys teguina]